MRHAFHVMTLCAALTLGLLTGTAQPASADEDVIGKLLLGAVVAALAFELLRSESAEPAVVARAPRAAPPVVRPRARAVAREVRSPEPRESLVAPEWTQREKRRACRQSLPTRRGEVVFIAERCLNHPRAKPRIPQNCLRDRWVDGGWRQVYSRECLAKYGEVL